MPRNITPLSSAGVRRLRAEMPLSPDVVLTPTLTQRGPHPLATALLVIGAFLSGYQLLHLGGINLTLADCAFLLAFAIGLARGQLTAIPFGAVTPFWLIGLTLMIGGLFLGSLYHIDMTRWLVIAFQYLFGFLALPMLFMAQPENLARRMVAAFIYGIVLMEALGIIASLTMTHAQAAAMFSDDFLAGNGRLSSFASEPNWNGAIIAFTLPLLIYAYSTGIVARWFAMMSAPLLGWALMLSASFTGFSASMVAIAITLVFLGLRYLGGTLLLAGIAASIFFASGAPVPAIFEKRVGSAISSGDIEEAGTYKGRVQLIKLAWHTSDRTLLVGLGADRFRTTNEIKQPVHNLYLLMLVEGGLMSLGGLLLLVALLFWMPISRIAHNRIEAGMALAVVSVFVIYSQSSPHLFSRLIIVPVLLALLILSKSDRGRIPKSYAARSIRPLRRPAAGIACGDPAAIR